MSSRLPPRSSDPLRGHDRSEHVGDGHGDLLQTQRQETWLRAWVIPTSLPVTQEHRSLGFEVRTCEWVWASDLKYMQRTKDQHS